MNKNRPVALFIPSLQCGGAQRVIVNLANSITELTDSPVHVVLVKMEGEFITDLNAQVRIVNLNSGRTLRAIRPLAKYLRRWRPRVLFSRMNYVNIVAILSWIAAGRECRLVISEANIFRTSSPLLSVRVRRKFLALLMKGFYRFSDCLVANSDATASSLKLHGIKKETPILVIPNPIELRSNNSNEAVGSEIDNCEWSGRFICSVGRLTEQKGFDCLLRAFADLDDKNIGLIICGEGPLRGELLAQAAELGVSERFYLPGFIRDTPSMMRRSSLFVLSSRWEGFGNVMIEALSVGVPIVSTDCPGAPRELLLGGDLGHLVPVDHPGALSAAITEALVEPRAAPWLRKKRADDFRASIVADRYLREAFRISPTVSEALPEE